ncbi:hypothetical protein NIES593_06800 [Hydrococcus rivularis NIES-593]|uniref:Uncharacterized protein n=1 Tax=Hydrococcus rivularis NIES-593 TaxID=1921803 RepID=A0A1U7HMY2_9CYAN|nr:hypothetical protein [Hydrococcus rivularis]OKH24914.1 hypothetical protein NIES593_06800 [Hydrococcus rivularis NIES-593]
MPSTKLANRILLCLVAFGAGCGIGFIADRDIKKALTTGAIATTASFIGASVVDRKNLRQERVVRNALKNKAQALRDEIDRLENYENQLRQSLMTTTNVRQEIELSLGNLNAERNYLINQINELHERREEIQQELPRLCEQKQELEKACEALQVELQQMSYFKKELDQIIADRQEQIDRDESCLTLLREEYQQLQDYISEIYAQKEQLDRDLYELESQKQQLLDSVNDLQLHICQLEEQKQSLTEIEPAEKTQEALLTTQTDGDRNISEASAPQWEEWDELLDSI